MTRTAPVRRRARQTASQAVHQAGRHVAGAPHAYAVAFEARPHDGPFGQERQAFRRGPGPLDHVPGAWPARTRS